MNKLHSLAIQWNYDTNEELTLAQSSDPVLKSFFTFKDWEFIQKNFKNIWEEEELDFEDRKIAFLDKEVCLWVKDRSAYLPKDEFLRVLASLYDLMIIGANEDHHSIRYEPWWQEFTEINYKMKCKIEMHNQLHLGTV
ncbi:hypothetical protein JHD50_04925 [Sulfurimonas sp. MAG313]|nr:hypothetical protein [Sulfurimonas sp. MAG313]MDF1880652.1 hypothetical protein [Sulfurimonas sp. MAG313]